MNVSYSKNFIKQARKLNPAHRRQLQQRIRIFGGNPLNPTLRNHALKGKYKDYRSIDITGDIRVLYLQRDDEIVFDLLGTHSQLYG